MRKKTLNDRNLIPRTYKHYSFLLNSSDDPQTWNFDHVLIPAVDEYHALHLYNLLNNPPRRKKAPPYPIFLKRVQIFEKVRHISVNIIQYRRVKDIAPP